MVLQLERQPARKDSLQIGKFASAVYGMGRIRRASDSVDWVMTSPSRAKRTPSAERCPHLKLTYFQGLGVARGRIELPTPRFSVVCSTN
jgi:hypothetical protein